MLTRIEIDGFKSFEGFALDLGPFMVLLGPNAAGKSNLFDALRFLSATATMDLRAAARQVRGEALGLFRRNADQSSAEQIRLAAEVLLPRQVRDPFGQEYPLGQTRVRYELEIGVRGAESGLGKMVVLSESAVPIRPNEDQWRAGIPKAERGQMLGYRRTKAFLTTDQQEGRVRFQLHQDGRAGRIRPAAAAESTVLREITTAEDFRHLYALRSELASWRFLQLDPSVLRQPSQEMANETLDPDGSNMATVLHRIQVETSSAHNPDGALADISADLAALIPGFYGFTVDPDPENREYRVRIRMAHEPILPAQVASDGTLRLLALLTLLHDPRQTGLVCFEEPENGLHPSRVTHLVRRLREMASFVSLGESGPATGVQLLLNSHSPVVLASIAEAEGVGAFIDAVTVSQPHMERIFRRSRVRPIQPVLPYTAEQAVSPVEVEQYLSHARPANPAEEDE